MQEQRNATIPASWQRPLQIIWLIVAVFYVAAHVLTIPLELGQPVQSSDWTQAEFQTAFAQLGVSLEIITVIGNSMSVVLPLFYFLLATLIYWHRRDDTVAFLASLL